MPAAKVCGVSLAAEHAIGRKATEMLTEGSAIYDVRTHNKAGAIIDGTAFIGPAAYSDACEYLEHVKQRDTAHEICFTRVAGDNQVDVIKPLKRDEQGHWI
jgi:hypothetical protein